MGAGARTLNLTADMAARAIVAAARSYGDDPVAACTAKQKSHARRTMTAAAGGLMILGVRGDQIERALSVTVATVYTVRSKKRSAFADAQLAAFRAAEYAGWRQEARESVAAGAAAETVPATPPASLPAGALTAKTAFQAKPRLAKARPPGAEPVRALVDVPDQGPVELPAEDAAHVNAVIRANKGRGFPALAKL